MSPFAAFTTVGVMPQST